MKKVLPLVILILTGIFVLAGYFFQSQLSPVIEMIINWGILLLGMMGILGVFYLVRMHFIRVLKGKKGAFYSIVLIVMFIVVAILGFVASSTNQFYRDLILNVQIPVEASLLGIIAVSLMITSLRLVRTKGWTPLTIAFMISALLTLFVNLGMFSFGEGSIGAISIWIFQRLQIAGARGLLIGMAIGGLIVGLRYLLTIERPFGEK
jgi:hypothetical protein